MAAIVENNLGFLLLNLGFTAESEEHLLCARRFFEALSDNVRHAQTSETLTRLYIAMNQFVLAQQTIEEAIQTLELTEREAVLAEALTTSGIVLSRLGSDADAKKRFEAAYKVAERCGDREGARRALLTMLDELDDRLDQHDLREILNKLKRLHPITEASSVVGRVEETISRIEGMIQ